MNSAASILVVQHQDDDPPAHFGRWLVEAGCSLDVRRPDLGEDLPATCEGHAGLMVLGGAMGAHDDADHPWLSATKRLIRSAGEQHIPTLGICLGHQLIAVALGGASRRNPLGQQAGLIEVGWSTAAREDALVGAASLTRARGVQWNYDVVNPMPTGTVVLAHAPAGEVQAARFGPLMWGLQMHPEADESIVGHWMTRGERSEIAARGDDPDAVLAEIGAARAELDRTWRPVATAFADILDRRIDA
ncbi:type 1 glutamine amidotransferase [Nocardioides sp.]|uniref:type 1 glutamine amidotransferase n=1 Tax=Nocardioides sp. TaxID=35761 RepID=UPI003566DFE4